MANAGNRMAKARSTRRLTMSRLPKLIAAYTLRALFLVTTTVAITNQVSGREQWYQCIRSKETYERHAVMGSKVLFLGSGPFRQAKARANPKLNITPGWEQGECLMDIRIFE